MTEDKAARYHRLKRRADIAGLLWGAALLLLLSFSGAARGLRDLARGATGGELYATVAVVVLAVVLLHEIVALPLEWYSGFSSAATTFRVRRLAPGHSITSRAPRSAPA